MTEKACPLRVSAGIIALGASQGRGVLPAGWDICVLPAGWDICVGSACAWFDAARECCAVLEAAKSLRALGK